MLLAGLTGKPMPFDAQSFPLDEVPPWAQFGIRRRDGRFVAVPLDGDKPAHGMCNTRHRCQQGYDDWVDRTLMPGTALPSDLADTLF